MHARLTTNVPRTLMSCIRSYCLDLHVRMRLARPGDQRDVRSVAGCA
jgi:hypothetical protein